MEQVEERPKSEVDGIRISRRQVMMGQWAFLGISCGKKKKIDPLFGLNSDHVWTGGERVNCGSLGWRVSGFSVKLATRPAADSGNEVEGRPWAV